MVGLRVLGRLEVGVGEEWGGMGAPKWGSVLAALLVDAGQMVRADALINEGWGDAPPARAANLISIYVLRLRRLMGDTGSSLLVTRAPGYLLRVTVEDTDALLFEAMMRDGRRAFDAGDPQGAAGRLAEALALWHGRPLADVPPTPRVEAEAGRLARLRPRAIELRVPGQAARGPHTHALPAGPRRRGGGAPRALRVGPGPAARRRRRLHWPRRAGQAPVRPAVRGGRAQRSRRGPDRRGGRRRRPREDLPGGARGPPDPAQVPRRPAVRRPARRDPEPAPGRRRAGQVPARPRRGRPGHPAGRGRARRPGPDRAGRAAGAGGAGQRARRGPAQAAAAGQPCVRGARHHAEPDARPGQHPAGRPQRARRR